MDVGIRVVVFSLWGWARYLVVVFSILIGEKEMVDRVFEDFLVINDICGLGIWYFLFLFRILVIISSVVVFMI